MRKSLILLLTILALAAFLRLYRAQDFPPGLYPDEAMNGNNALEALRNTNFSAGGGPTFGWQVFYPENNGREGLFINIQALSLKFFGACPVDSCSKYHSFFANAIKSLLNIKPNASATEELYGVNEPWALRFPSFIFGILTVLSLYFLGRELFSENVGLLSAFLLATSFWHINFSRIGFRAITAPFWLVWGVFFLLIGYKKLREKKPLFAICYLLFAGVLYGAGFHSYIAYRATPLIIFVIFAYYFSRSRKEGWFKQFVLGTFLFGITATIVVSPLLWYFYTHSGSFFGRTTQVSIFQSANPIKDLALNTLKTLGMFNFIGDFNWRHNYAGAPELYWPVGILFLLGITLGLRTLIKKLKDRFIESKTAFSFLVLFAWFLFAMAPVIISNEGLPHALRAILMIPPVIILAAWAGVRIYEWMKKYLNQKLYVPIVYLFVALLTLHAYLRYFVDWGQNPNTPGAFARNYVDVAHEILKLPREVPKYVIVRASGVMVREPMSEIEMPMPTQTVMFLTDTWSPDDQKAKNIYYVASENENQIPPGSLKFNLN